jgi:multidrug efflux pump subunit AcrA (membrane-fusion protein)
MKKTLSHDGRLTARPRAAAVALVTLLLLEPASGQPANPTPPPVPGSTNPTVELSGNQLNAITIGTVGTHRFPIERTAVGNVDFDDDLSVQVFPSYQGKLLKTFAELGDDVQPGQTLYTIDSPDLVQAESTLIGAAATVVVTGNGTSSSVMRPNTGTPSGRSATSRWAARLPAG